MPLRSPKPYYRVIKKKDSIVVSYFTAKNMRLLPKEHIELPRHDVEGAKQELDGFVKRQTGEGTTQE